MSLDLRKSTKKSLSGNYMLHEDNSYYETGADNENIDRGKVLKTRNATQQGGWVVLDLLRCFSRGLCVVRMGEFGCYVILTIGIIIQTQKRLPPSLKLT